jgi:HSP20 family molecular chaperone IbpA
MDTSIWEEMATMEQRLDKEVHEALGTNAHLAHPVLPLFFRRPFVPAMKVFKRRGDLIARLKLPGIDPSADVRISVEDGDVVITGHWPPRRNKVERDAYYRLEAGFGAFRRRVPLPSWVNDGAITTTYAGGVLDILVPKGRARRQP